MYTQALKESQIQEIADQIDVGFKCFWSREDGELIFIPDEFRFPTMDFDAFEEDMDKIDENIGSYDVILPLESREGFKIMEEFADALSDSNKLKDQLFNALNRRKPFREFQWVIDNSGEYRDVWFRFKNRWLRDWVKEKGEEIIEYRKQMLSKDEDESGSEED